MPSGVNKALRSITPIISILFVGLLLLCSVLGAMHVLSMPGWLVGSNIAALKISIQTKKKEIQALRKHKANVNQSVAKDKAHFEQVSNDIESDDEEQDG